MPEGQRDSGQEFPRVSVDEAYDNLKTFGIRGGGRVARYAVQALRDSANAASSRTPAEYWARVLNAGERLKSARPTSVALTNGVDYVLRRGETRLKSGGSPGEVMDATVDAANDFLAYSRDALRVIGEIGSRRLKNGDTVMTHSNSEAAISIMKKAHDMGMGIKVYCSETRPNYQGHGAAAELAAYGIDTTLICDSACRVYMANADRTIVGCDAISVNGAFASRIGVSQLAALAQEARVNFIVGAETYKVDFGTMTGKQLDVEQRDPTEIASKEWMAQNPKVKLDNHVYDFTPPEYVDFYVTEKGITPPGGIFELMQSLRSHAATWSPE